MALRHTDQYFFFRCEALRRTAGSDWRRRGCSLGLHSVAGHLTDHDLPSFWSAISRMRKTQDLFAVGEQKTPPAKIPSMGSKLVRKTTHQRS